MLKKSIKWTVIVALVGGLTNCMMLDQDRSYAPQNPPAYEQNTGKQAKTVKTTTTTTTTTTGKVSKSSGTEPVQKSTPGPKRAAAPQLPVIQ